MCFSPYHLTQPRKTLYAVESIGEEVQRNQ